MRESLLSTSTLKRHHRSVTLLGQDTENDKLYMASPNENACRYRLGKAICHGDADSGKGKEVVALAACRKPQPPDADVALVVTCQTIPYWESSSPPATMRSAICIEASRLADRYRRNVPCIVLYDTMTEENADHSLGSA